jgi:hypothetical protein
VCVPGVIGSSALALLRIVPAASHQARSDTAGPHLRGETNGLITALRSRKSPTDATGGHPATTAFATGALDLLTAQLRFVRRLAGMPEPDGRAAGVTRG